MATSTMYKTILKRSRCLNSLNESEFDSQKRYENLISVLGRSESGKEARLQEALRLYFDSMSNLKNANENYMQPLELAVEFNKVNSAITDTTIFYNYTNRILPYVETNNLVSLSDYVKYSVLTESQKNVLIDSIEELTTADRVLKNHNMISSRFNIEKEVAKYSTLGMKYLVDSVANMIDTYPVVNYQRMNITIEEVDYLLDKNSIDHNTLDIAKYVVEYYFTQTPYISSSDSNKYRKVLTESRIIKASDLKEMKYVFEDQEVTTISEMVNNYIVSNNKYTEDLTNSVEDIMSKTFKDDIVYNSDKIIYLLWDLAKSKVFESDKEVYYVSQIIPQSIEKALEENAYSYAKEDIINIIESIEASKDYIHATGNSNIDYSVSADLFIKESITPCIEKLKDIKNLIYTKANLAIMDKLNNIKAPKVDKEKFKPKFHNLIRATSNLDKFLKVKEKKVYNKAKDKITDFVKKSNSVLFGENYNMYDYIGSDHKADICVRRYNFNESDTNNVSEFLDLVCNEYNDVLASQNDSCRTYYMINPGLAEIRIKESTAIFGEEVDYMIENSDVDPSVCFDVNDISEFETICDKVPNNTESIEDMIKKSINENFTLEQFELALEAMSIIGVEEDLVSLFGEKFNQYQFDKTLEDGLINESYIKLAKQERIVNEAVNEWTVLESSFEDKVEAYNLLTSIFEYSFPSSADDDDDEDDEDEKTEDKKEEKKEDNSKAKSQIEELKKDNENMAKEMEQEVKEKAPKDGKPYKAKFSINDIKLAINGIKTKLKDMDTKQKEICNNMDNATRALVKGIKDSLVSNRREAIIKGSVIPSFSRCIKAAILLAGVGLFSLPLAVIGAVGALALSKKLTDKERALLLDEIETELEVVDKELSIAENNNNIKQYRTLLQYKKDLQRQYQRIKYNIRIGKDLLPGTAGFRTEE